MALTQESILSFLLEHGGKVKNSDLVNHFRSMLNSDDPAEKQHNRDLFKKLVNSVAVVKQLNETTFVVVKKRYLDFIKDPARSASPQTDLYSSQNTSFSFADPRPAQTVKASYTDVENKNVPEGNVSCVDSTTVRVLNIPGHQAHRARKAGSVFAVVAVKSPPRTSEETHDKLHQKTSVESTLVRVSTRAAPSAHLPAHKHDVLGVWAQDVQPTAVPPVRPPSMTLKQGEEYSDSVPLDPLAHEWLVNCAAGQWGKVYALLLQDIQLAQRKDFMSGFTVLHWAAKGGNGEIIKKIMDISRKKGTFINVNSKAHGGYTPLHIAAMHGHTKVMLLLVQGFGANINKRDNDGKKAFHYLGKTVSAEVRALMGALQLNKYREKRDEGECRKQPRSINTISKHFHSHRGKKHRVAKYAQDW